MNNLEWMFTWVAITEIVCFLWFINTLFVEIWKFQAQCEPNKPSASTALIDKRHNSIQSFKYSTEDNSVSFPQSLSVISIHEKELSNKSHRTHITDSNKASTQCKHFKCGFIKMYCFFQILIASFTVFLSTLMMYNKIWYKFFSKNVWFITSHNFNYMNNTYKTLTIISLCYLWNISRYNNGVKNGLLQVMYKSKWYSFDRQYFMVMLGFLISYNLAYDFFVKKQKWNNGWTHIMANLFDDIFVCIVIPLVLSIDYNLKSKYEKVDRYKWRLYVQMYLINVLFLNIIIVLKYNILVYLIEETTFSEGMSVSRSAGWSIYGFCNNYLMSRLIKMFGTKILFHDWKARPPKCEKIQ
eukprot:299726_1